MAKKILNYILKPEFYNPGKSGDLAKVKRLHGNKNIRVVDDLENELKELYLSRHPRLKFNPKAAEEESRKYAKSWFKNKTQQGVWVYFPWNKTLIRILPKKEFLELRSSRNRNLITANGQKKIQSAKIGVLGMSVGNSVANTLALQGFTNFHVSDFDELSVSNLNRIRAGVQYLGMNKAVICAQQIIDINPYAEVVVFTKLEEGSLAEFFGKNRGQLSLVVDEIDDVTDKVRLRLEARKRRIPVVSAADNGDNCIVDIERFDKEPKRKIYHGEIPDITPEQIRKMDFVQKFELINRMVGQRFVTQKMKQSLEEVGKSIYTWPQLGNAAMLTGASAAMVVKEIITGSNIKSGKYNVALDKIFIK